MYVSKSSLRCLSVMAMFVILSTVLIFASCKDDTVPDPNNTSQSSISSVTTESEFDLTDPPNIPVAAINMIKPSDKCPGWKSGSNVHNAQYYVSDMIDLLDAQVWTDSNKVPVTNDYHFRIYIDRPLSELNHYLTDPNESVTTTALTTKSVTETSETLATHTSSTEKPTTVTSTAASAPSPDPSVQYLINIETGVVNARFSGVDVYATLEGVDLGMLKAYLKYYFGPNK